MTFFWKMILIITGELISNRDESDDNMIEVIGGN